MQLPGYTIQEEVYRGRKRVVYRGRRDADQAPVILKTPADDFPAPADVSRLSREHDREAGAMLRITKLARRSAGTTLRVEGRLVADWGPFLEGECARVEDEGQPLRLDPADVTYVDARGLAALRRLVRRGIALANCMPLVAELLAEDDSR